MTFVYLWAYRPSRGRHIADADAYGVVTCAVSTCLVLGATDMDGAIAIDDEVVANLAEASLTMPAVDVGNCVVTTFGCGTTMDDDFCDFSHVD